MRGVFDPFVGIHKIQRIPPTEKNGRRHTSTVTVALTKFKSNIEIDESQIILRFMKGSGPGGQHRNKTENACLATYVPTGLTAYADTRSKEQSKKQAIAELKRRVQDDLDLSLNEIINDSRKDQIRDNAWTHNFQRGESINHKTGKRYKVKDFLSGKI